MQWGYVLAPLNAEVLLVRIRTQLKPGQPAVSAWGLLLLCSLAHL
jgi:hypothetical protein